MYETASNGLHFVDPDGANDDMLPNTGQWRDARVSPDGTRVAFVARDSEEHDVEIYIGTVDGEVAAKLMSNADNDERPFWSPDGSKIGFARDRGLWVMNADGTGKTYLGRLPAFPAVLDWSPDGTRIAYTTYSRPSYLAIMRADGSDIADPLMLTGFGWPSWSPDSSRIATTRSVQLSESEYASELWVVNADGTDPVLLAGGTGKHYKPVWSPTSNTIAFLRGGDIYTIAAAGGPATRAVHPGSTAVDVDWTAAIPCTVEGTDGSEVLTGTPGDDVICARSGADRIIVSAGDDLILGGRGMDKLDYREWHRGAVLDLRARTSRAGAHAAELLGIESALGSPFDDQFFGNDTRNVFAGFGGNDALIGKGDDDTLSGGDGNDLLRPGTGGDDANGGEGKDSVSFFDASERVRVNLGNHLAFGEGEDILIGLEKVIGSSFDDYIVGNGAANVLKGGDGEDTLDGQDGPDDIYGGDERDFLFGRDGYDELYGEAGRDYVDGGEGDDGCFTAEQVTKC
jgi:hypothetical protein